MVHLVTQVHFTVLSWFLCGFGIASQLYPSMGDHFMSEPSCHICQVVVILCYSAPLRLSQYFRFACATGAVMVSSGCCHCYILLPFLFNCLFISAVITIHCLLLHFFNVCVCPIFVKKIIYDIDNPESSDFRDVWIPYLVTSTSRHS